LKVKVDEKLTFLSANIPPTEVVACPHATMHGPYEEFLASELWL